MNFPMCALSRNQFGAPKPEFRISNKKFRMMKLNLFCFFLRRSLFVIRYSAVYPPPAGSILHFPAAIRVVRGQERSYRRRRNRSMESLMLSCIRPMASARSPISSFEVTGISASISPTLICSATEVSFLILLVSRVP